MVHSLFVSVPVPVPLPLPGFVPNAISVAAWAVLSAAALTAQAQPAGKTQRPDPLDAAASVPAQRYESAFARYRGLGGEKPVSWREANDTVARIGGWRVYAREAQQPDSPPAAQLAPPMPGAHGEHKKP